MNMAKTQIMLIRSNRFNRFCYELKTLEHWNYCYCLCKLGAMVFLTTIYNTENKIESVCPNAYYYKVLEFTYLFTLIYV